MSFKCKVCDQEFETERQLHAHLKAHKLRVAAYYQQYYPRYDLHDGKIIKFKSKEYYFNTEFNSRTNQLKWLDNLSDLESKKYLKKLLVERKEKKQLVYSPSQVELRSTSIPSIISYEKKIGDYYSFCKSLGFKNKYENVKNIATGSVPKESKDLKVYIDSREQLPLKFNLPTEVKGLKFGDYALSDKSLTCNCYRD
jgi:1,4-alpha-glucan branching enzyme